MFPRKTPTGNKSRGPGALLAIYRKTKSGLTQEPESTAANGGNRVVMQTNRKAGHSPSIVTILSDCPAGQAENFCNSASLLLTL